MRSHGSLSFESVAHFELAVHAPLLGSGERAAVDTFVSKKRDGSSYTIGSSWAPSYFQVLVRLTRQTHDVTSCQYSYRKSGTVVTLLLSVLSKSNQCFKLKWLLLIFFVGFFEFNNRKNASN